MLNEPLVSLCIPTNGIIEWMVPVLDSIFNQGVDEQLFEVIVTDNGNNEEFHAKMLQYCEKHKNIVYEHTDAPLFLNEIESYKRASGKFIKFINHRTMLKPGTINCFVGFVKENMMDKPIVYFSNGVLEHIDASFECNNFDMFIRKLSYWSSWSTGMGFWKEDFENLRHNLHYNELFPHTSILFGERKRDRYIIDNRELLEELSVGNIPKGRYDLFFAFAVEYPAIICDMVRSGDVSTDTFLSIKQELLYFIMDHYWNYVLCKRECSYDLSSYEKSIRVFYNRRDSYRCLRQVLTKYLKNKFWKLKQILCIRK